jgi:hypothetical protein
MKNVSLVLIWCSILFSCNQKVREPRGVVKTPKFKESSRLYLDVHNLQPGKVTFADVAGAHKKDLAVQDKYGVNFIRYWLDERAGKVYCLAESPDSASVYHTHKEAHGLVPDRVHQVTGGAEATIRTKSPLFFDIHRLGSGNVTVADVANAHAKDLAVQDKYAVNFINYWVDEKLGIVMCLAEAPTSESLIDAHKEAHGLIPDEVHKVQEGE